MNFLVFQIKNCYDIAKKHKFITILMVLFIFIILTIFGKLMGMSLTSNETAKKYDETYGNKIYYYTNESFEDSTYVGYLDDKQAFIYQKISNFEKLLKNSKSFKYIELIEQQLEIFEPEIQEKFLLNYEIGEADESIFEYEDKTLYATKTLQVSTSFFEEFNIKISEGTIFSDEDYKFNSSSNSIPILMGSEYKNIFKIGETIHGYYITEEFSFIIKGFISEDSFFFSRYDNDLISCGRYIIMPALEFEDASEIARIVLLQKLTGMISSTSGYEDTLKQFNTLMQEAKVGDLNLNFIYPKAAQEDQSILKKYSAMTNDVANQFIIMVFIIMFFGIIATTMTLCSMLRENRLNFGIEMLCGATKFDIFMIAFFLLLVILLLGDALCLSILAIDGVNIFVICYIQIVTLGMFITSAVFSAVFVTKMPMHDIIGGNE